MNQSTTIDSRAIWDEIARPGRRRREPLLSHSHEDSRLERRVIQESQYHPTPIERQHAADDVPTTYLVEAIARGQRWLEAERDSDQDSTD